jgi:hypothetical protein
MYAKSFIALLSATRSLFSSRRSLALMLAAYSGLLIAIYLFVSTREATIPQLLLTLLAVVAAPALFFVWQALSVNYANQPSSVRKVAIDCLKLIVVSLPVIALTFLAVYGLNKIQTHPTIVTTVRYLLLAVVAPLFTIQLWIAIITSGLRALVRSSKRVLLGTFAPHSLLVYACGFLIFAVVPYVLLQNTIPIVRPWIEFSVLVARLAASALLIFLGWVTTVGAISVISRNNYLPENKV